MKRNLWRKVKCFPNAIAGGLLLLASLLFYSQLGEIKRLSSLSDSVGPRFFPQLILIVLMALSLMILIPDIPRGRKRLKELGDEPVQEQSRQESAGLVRRLMNAVENKPTVRTWISILGIFLFILLMKPLGFAISGAIYLFLQFTLLAPREKRKIWLYAILAIVISFGAYWVFRYAIQISLPAGLLKDLI